jgi:hypothetical protein
MPFKTKTKMEDIAWEAGVSVGLEWDGESVDESLEVLRIANHWDERELAAFKAGFEDGRKDLEDDDLDESGDDGTGI